MALPARGAEPSSGVVHAGKRCLIVLLLMAADAIGSGAIERSISRLEVALGAGKHRVPPDQREIGSAVRVRGEQRLPILLVMAALASLSQLTFVRIEMAATAHRGQRSFKVPLVTAPAVQMLMLSLQGKSGGIVIDAGAHPARS